MPIVAVEEISEMIDKIDDVEEGGGQATIRSTFLSRGCSVSID